MLQERRGHLDGLGIQRLLFLPEPRSNGTQSTAWSSDTRMAPLCTEMIHRKPPGGEGRWLGKASPEEQEGVFFKGVWCKGQKPSATTC